MIEISLSGISSGSWFRADAETLSTDYGKILLTKELLEGHAVFLERESLYLALSLNTDDDVKSLTVWFPMLKMIELNIGKFTDGRVFTQARALREAGFKGEIKVVGPVIPDQAGFFARVGVDTLVIENSDRAEAFKSVLQRHKIFYQTSSDGKRQIARLREQGQTERLAAS